MPGAAADVGFFFVWQPVLTDDAPARAAEHAAAERDPRARHYWDGGLGLGTAWADPLQTPFDDGPNDKPLAWDVVMVFPAGARWPADRLPVPALHMFPRDSAGGPGF